MNSNNVGNDVERPVRIDRFVSVILNGVALNKLAAQHDHDVTAMAGSLMSNLSGPVQRNIRQQELAHIDQNLKMEIGRRINIPQAI